RLRRHPRGQALLGQLQDARSVAHQGLVVQGLENLVWAHAAPSFPGLYPSVVDTLRSSVSSSPPMLAALRRVIRVIGPDTDTAATTEPSLARSGAATAASPASSSSQVTAYPCCCTVARSRSSSVRVPSDAAVRRSSRPDGSSIAP